MILMKTDASFDASSAPHSSSLGRDRVFTGATRVFEARMHTETLPSVFMARQGITATYAFSDASAKT